MAAKQLQVTSRVPPFAEQTAIIRENSPNASFDAYKEKVQVFFLSTAHQLPTLAN